MLKQFYMIFKKLVVFALFFRTWRFHFIFDFLFPQSSSCAIKYYVSKLKKSVPDFHSFYGMESFINQYPFAHFELPIESIANRLFHTVKRVEAWNRFFNWEFIGKQDKSLHVVFTRNISVFYFKKVFKTSRQPE